MIKPASSFGDSITSESRLVVALAEEVSVDERGNEGVLEGNGTKENANEDDKFSICNDLHRGVVVSYNRVEKIQPNAELQQGTHP